MPGPADHHCFPSVHCQVTMKDSDLRLIGIGDWLIDRNARVCFLTKSQAKPHLEFELATPIISVVHIREPRQNPCDSGANQRPMLHLRKFWSKLAKDPFLGFIFQSCRSSHCLGPKLCHWYCRSCGGRGLGPAFGRGSCHDIIFG
jgi:hypothetical protein